MNLFKQSQFNMRLKISPLLSAFFILSAISLLVNSQCPPKCICSSEDEAVCTNSSLDEIPRSGFNRRLQKLNVSFNDIISLDGNSLKHLSSLTHLNASHNSIAFIHSETFITIKNLKELDLSFNNISNLHPQTFLYNKKLEWISLSMNERIRLPEKDSLYLPNLQVLHISHSCIPNIPPETFHKFQDLEELYLDNNYISYLDPDVFTTLAQLKSLHIQNNNFSSLNYEVFSPLLSLIHLDVSNNSLALIDSKFLRVVSKVEYLNLENNPWRCDCDLYDAYNFCVHEENCTLNLTCKFPERFAGLFWSFIEKLQCIEDVDILITSNVPEEVEIVTVRQEIPSTTEEAPDQSVWVMITIALVVGCLACFVVIVILALMLCRSGREEMDDHPDEQNDGDSSHAYDDSDENGFEQVPLDDLSSS